MARKKTPSPFILAIFGSLVAGYLWLVRHTLRWQVVGEANHVRLVESEQPFILTSWHGRLLMMPVVAKKHRLPSVSLSSNHKDGDIMVAILKRLGIEAVRGSSSNSNKREKNKGGAGAFRALLGEIRAGKIIGMTPDGPRGPRQEAQAGTLQLARMAGAPILPMSFSTRYAKIFDSWDRFMVPLPIPFGKAVLVFGEPYVVDARGDDAVEAARVHLVAVLNQVQEQADMLAGVKPVPGPFATEAA